MSAYKNMIKELIVQSHINWRLLNDVNNKFYEIDKKRKENENNPETQAKINYDLKDVYEDHEYYVNYKYRDLNIDFNCKYFDGTQLINSLFSCIVVPFEYLKGKKHKDRYSVHDFNIFLRNQNQEAYDSCNKIIKRIIVNNNIFHNFGKNQNFWADENNYSNFPESIGNVYKFFEHLRNSLSHSGNGQIHFFPNRKSQINYSANTNDNQENLNEENIITHLYFYDEDKKDKNNETHYAYRRYGTKDKYFIAKINILEELIPLVEAFNKIVLSIKDTEDTPYDIEYIKTELNNIMDKNTLDDLFKEKTDNKENSKNK